MFNKIKDSLIKELLFQYPNIEELEIEKKFNKGIVNRVFAAKNNKGRYVVKVYGGSFKKVKSEHRTLVYANKAILSSPVFFKNKRGDSFFKSNVLSSYVGVYKHKIGSHKNVNTTTARNAGFYLGKIHKSLAKNKIENTGVISISLKKEFYKNMRDFKKILSYIKNKKILTKKDGVIKKVILKKIKMLHSYNFSKDLSLMCNSSRGIIHGDFAPSNIIFKGNEINGILDWENACVYHVAWEIIRSICHFSKIGNYGIICSKLKLKIAEIFIGGYFSINKISKKDIVALKLMIKYYYVLDPYIITSYVLKKNRKTGKLVSDNLNDHFWLENNNELLEKIITKYA